jgi:hypothetical protein
MSAVRSRQHPPNTINNLPDSRKRRFDRPRDPCGTSSAIVSDVTPLTSISPVPPSCSRSRSGWPSPAGCPVLRQCISSSPETTCAPADPAGPRTCAAGRAPAPAEHGKGASCPNSARYVRWPAVAPIHPEFHRRPTRLGIPPAAFSATPFSEASAQPLPARVVRCGGFRSNSIRRS